jgi:hypothetical protein
VTYLGSLSVRLAGAVGSRFAGCSAADRPSTCGWVGYFISNLIASWAQPDTGFPPKVIAGR